MILICIFNLLYCIKYLVDSSQSGRSVANNSQSEMTSVKDESLYDSGPNTPATMKYVDQDLVKISTFLGYISRPPSCAEP